MYEIKERQHEWYRPFSSTPEYEVVYEVYRNGQHICSFNYRTQANEFINQLIKQQTTTTNGKQF